MPPPPTTEDSWAWLRGGSATAALVREVDWAATPVGPAETWPSSLKSVVAMVLHSKHPMFVWWGPELVQFYNDAYVPSFGVGRHPSAMGQRGRECWGEIWDIIGPQINGVMQRAEPTFHEDALVPIFRNGRLEEVYWTYGYSPLFELDGTVAGTLVVVTETTARVVVARRLRVSRALSDAIAPVLDAGNLDLAIVATLAFARDDSPWALVYRTTREPARPHTVHSTGLDDAQEDAVVALLERRLAARATPDDDDFYPLDVAAVRALPSGPWPEPCTQAVALPISAATHDRQGYLVVGLSPRLPFDHDYEDHLLGLARQLVSAAARIDALRAHVEAERDRNNLLLQAPVAAALLVGPDWRHQIANPRYEQMIGRRVVGGAWRELFPELRGGPVEAILDGVYRGGQPFFASEQLVPFARERDGMVEDRFFDFNIIPIRDAAGAVDAMMIVAVELTAQVTARRELERTGREREKLLIELETANRAKDVFLAMLGHELRNPLSPIVTALQLIRLRGTTGSERELDVIDRQITHVVRLVDDLLDVSKVTSGKIELRRQISDVKGIIARAIEIASALFEERGHELTVEQPERLTWDGDPTRLAQVIANLLTNAARYTEPGGHVLVSATGEGGELVVRVRDDGRGIDAALLPNIFDAFVQAARTVDRHEGGLGLGLALVKGLVHLHGGTVQVHSAGPGHGSEFIVRVPGLLDAEATQSARSAARISASRPREGPGRRVLLVDDNLDAATLLAEMLELSGHVTAVAHDGPAALALVDRFVPDVAVLDIGLPVMDGYELVAKLRERLGGVRCRYVALTGYGQDSDRVRSAAAGFDRHLVKPIDLAQLERLLAEA